MNDRGNQPNIKDSTDESFIVDVIEASKELPVIVDFWAPWCGPCKTLGPALEAAVKENDKKVRLVKIDIDKNPNVAGQLRVQSIPAVFAFSNGQPVDGFMGAQTPSQVKEFITKIVDGFGPEDDGLTTAVKSAQDMLNEQDFLAAIEIFQAVISEDPNLTSAHVGLIKGFLGSKDHTEAKIAFEAVPNAIKNDPNIKTVYAQIQLAEQTSSAEKTDVIKQKLLLSPEDLNIKFDLALGLIAEDQNEEAISTLLQIVRTEVDWSDGKAKKQILELLEALGPDSQEGRTGRRKLSSILFP